VLTPSPHQSSDIKKIRDRRVRNRECRDKNREIVVLPFDAVWLNQARASLHDRWRTNSSQTLKTGGSGFSVQLISADVAERRRRTILIF
jgi:hypothetical protein